MAEWQFPDHRRAIGSRAAPDTSEADRRFYCPETLDERGGERRARASCGESVQLWWLRA